MEPRGEIPSQPCRNCSKTNLTFRHRSPLPSLRCCSLFLHSFIWLSKFSLIYFISPFSHFSLARMSSCVWDCNISCLVQTSIFYTVVSNYVPFYYFWPFTSFQSCFFLFSICFFIRSFVVIIIIIIIITLFLSFCFSLCEVNEVWNVSSCSGSKEVKVAVKCAVMG